MKNHAKWSVYLLLALLLLPLLSCGTDIKEVQKLNYATALGVDFKDGKYHLYIQLIGLSSIASSEGQEATPQTFVSESQGSTFIDSFFEVYETGQEKFIWSHITSIVLSESVLDAGIENIFDGITRYYEFRLTPWVFATKEPLDEVLSTFGFYDQSSLETILHNPQRIYEQSSMIRPIKLHQFAQEIFEPARTTYVPSITVNKDRWEKSGEVEKKLELDGAFFIKNNQYKGFYTLEQLQGLRWIDPGTVRASVLVPTEENAETLIVIDHVNFDIDVKEDQQTFDFQVNLHGEGNIANLVHGVNKLKTITEKTNKSVADQISALYKLGVENDTDFLNLEHIVYRQKNKEWKQMQKGLVLQEDLLSGITVDISILHSGAFKNSQVDVD